jgi:hypothetical protein
LLQSARCRDNPLDGDAICHYAFYMTKHINKHTLPRLAGPAKVVHSSVFWGQPNSQAARGLDKPKQWFWKGLERFVNTGNSADDYHALASAFPTFWPLPVGDARGNELGWSDPAQGLFNFYRDVLRKFWTRERNALRNGLYAELLFGTLTLETAGSLLVDAFAYDAELEKALLPLRGEAGELRLRNPLPLATFWPDWNAKTVEYCSQTDFQRAIWSLFLESWRTRVCLSCELYFIAAKPPQFYCSVACSNRAHRANSLKWWRETGARRRTTRNRPKNRHTRILPSRRTKT